MQGTARPQRTVSTAGTALLEPRLAVMVPYRTLHEAVCVSTEILHGFGFGMERGDVLSLPPVAKLQHIVSLTFCQQY